MTVNSHRVQVRPALDRIATYKPGKGKPGKMTKLSSNENPFPPLPEVIEAAARAAQTANRYPDMLASPLVDALAEHHSIDPSRLVIGNGSCSVIAHMLQAVATEGDEVVMPWPSFEAYPILIGISGAQARSVPLIDYLHDPEGLVDAVTDATRAVLLCTPNNPTSTPLRSDAFSYVMDNVPDNVLVLLDEAYIEFDNSSERLDGIALTERYPNLVAARTFSKAYGLCGLRVGYSVSSPFIAECIRKTTPPFAVNHVAQMAAVEALAHAEEVAAQVETIRGDRDALHDEVTRRGFVVPRSASNFLWFPGEKAREAIVAACERHNVVVRAFPEGVRVSVGSAEDNERFLAALDEVDPEATAPSLTA